MATGPCGMDCMDPVDIGPGAVSPIDDDPSSFSMDLRGHATSIQREQRTTERVSTQRPSHSMPPNERVVTQRRSHGVSDEIDGGPSFRREIPSQLIVRTVHSAPGDEIASNKQNPWPGRTCQPTRADQILAPITRGRPAGWSKRWRVAPLSDCAAPCSAPASSQYCKPT